MRLLVSVMDYLIAYSRGALSLFEGNGNKSQAQDVKWWGSMHFILHVTACKLAEIRWMFS